MIGIGLDIPTSSVLGRADAPAGFTFLLMSDGTPYLDAQGNNILVRI